jgi:hypothetical protein
MRRMSSRNTAEEQRGAKAVHHDAVRGLHRLAAERFVISIRAQPIRQQQSVGVHRPAQRLGQRHRDPDGDPPDHPQPDHGGGRADRRPEVRRPEALELAQAAHVDEVDGGHQDDPGQRRQRQRGEESDHPRMRIVLTVMFRVITRG